MRHEIGVFLEDIQLAIVDIESFVAGVNEGEFLTDAMRQAAVERKFIVVGEALNQISRQLVGNEIGISRLREIVDFRNRLVHGYRLVAPIRIYAVVKMDMPLLKKEVAALLLEY